MENNYKKLEQVLERYLGIINNDLSNEEIINELTKIVDKQQPNLVLLTDAYKYSHPTLYTEGLTYLVSYLESRGGKFNHVVFFGLQYIIKKYLMGRVLTEEMVYEADNKLNTQNGVFSGNNIFPTEKWLNLVRKHNGYLPIRIKAVKEGSICPTHNVLLKLESTDPEFAWLVGFLETIILQIWYPITVCTLSKKIKSNLKNYFSDSGCPDTYLGYILNDFGVRGVSSIESASIGGAAHLVNFDGGDNVIASDMITKFYNSNIMYGKSIPATEHSICTMEGEQGELNVFKRVLEKYPTGIVACVSDSFNILRACEQYWGEDLKVEILKREGTLTLRPDSGHPIATLRKVFTILFDKFGFTTNKMGYKVLPPQVRVIQGDGINYESINEIYEMLKEEKISPENLVLGMGGKLLQLGIDRDLQNFAIKACYATINGKTVEIVKSPLELDKNGEVKQSFKKSKKGDVKLIKDENNQFKTITSSEYLDFDNYKDELVTVFENGKLLVDYTFDEIRNLADKYSI